KQKKHCSADEQNHLAPATVWRGGWRWQWNFIRIDWSIRVLLRDSKRRCNKVSCWFILWSTGGRRLRYRIIRIVSRTRNVVKRFYTTVGTECRSLWKLCTTRKTLHKSHPYRCLNFS